MLLIKQKQLLFWINGSIHDETKSIIHPLFLDTRLEISNDNSSKSKTILCERKR